MALSTHRWTRDDLQRLPDDGNKYEVIHGELLVTPAPLPVHESLIEAFLRVLRPYCEREGIGYASAANPAFVTDDSEVIPDIVVRERLVPPPAKWDYAPKPILLVEVLSESSRRTDRVKKRDFYMETAIPEYWIVDGTDRTVVVVTAAGARTESATLRWNPVGATQTLTIDLAKLFERALGPR